MKDEEKTDEVITEEALVPIRRVYQVVVKFEAAQPIEALIVADSEAEAVEAVQARLAEENAPDHEYEVEEMTPDYIETMYLAATDPESPFGAIGVNVDMSDIPKAVLDVLLPRCENGTKIREFIESGAKVPNFKVVKG